MAVLLNVSLARRGYCDLRMPELRASLEIRIASVTMNA
jgi:hypothetical protein